MSNEVTIGVLYSCKDCGVTDRVVQVRERSSLEEDVANWCHQVMIVAVGKDHMQVSPSCCAPTVDIKIPLASKENFIVGQARRQ